MMKKKDLLSVFLVLALISLSRSGISAQVSVGLSGGGGFTQSTGFRAALPVEISMTKNSYLFGDLAFIQRRNRELVRKLSNSREYLSAELDYLSLPLFIKIQLDWSPVRIYGLAGIEVSYGVRLQATGVEDQRLFKEKLDFALIEVSRIDGGITGGFGFETDLRDGRKIFADIRYYLGLLDIDQSVLGEIYNEGSFVNLGLLMPLRR